MPEKQIVRKRLIFSSIFKVILVTEEISKKLFFWFPLGRRLHKVPGQPRGERARRWVGGAPRRPLAPAPQWGHLPAGRGGGAAACHVLRSLWVAIFYWFLWKKMLTIFIKFETQHVHMFSNGKKGIRCSRFKYWSVLRSLWVAVFVKFETHILRVFEKVIFA